MKASLWLGEFTKAPAQSSCLATAVPTATSCAGYMDSRLRGPSPRRHIRVYQQHLAGSADHALGARAPATAIVPAGVRRPVLLIFASSPSSSTPTKQFCTRRGLRLAVFFSGVPRGRLDLQAGFSPPGAIASTWHAQPALSHELRAPDSIADHAGRWCGSRLVLLVSSNTRPCLPARCISLPRERHIPPDAQRSGCR